MAKATPKAKPAASSSKAKAAKPKPTAAKKTAKPAAKATKGKAKAAPKKGARKGKATKVRADGDWQLAGGWIEVFDEPATPTPDVPARESWADHLTAPAPEAAMETAAPVQDAPEPEVAASEPAEEAVPQADEVAAEPDSPEDDSPVAVDEIPVVAAQAESPSDDVVEPEGMVTMDDEEPEEDEPAPAPIPDGPIHPEREPAPIEHPDETEPADDSADDLDVGMVTMEEPPAAPAEADEPGQTQAVVQQRAAMPLSQEMPARGDIASGLSLPEQFLLVAYRPGWDDKMTKAKPGGQGAALVGSLVLELALRGAVKVQRGRFAVEDAIALPPELAGVADQLRALGPVTTQVAMEKLSKGLPDRLRPWVQALERRGVLREERSRKLGIVSRSQLVLVNEGAKDKLENRLVRTLAGGGNPDARTIMLLGLVSASGLLRDLVPASAYDFNRKRIQALLSGRDTLSYRVDNSIRRVQDLALQTVLQDIRVLQGT